MLGGTDWLTGPGDDGAAVPALGAHVVACGEALLPAFVRADPYGAGVAAVLTNLNDLAAMGAEPLGIVDTIVGDEATARAALRGMRMAAELYGVPILGGHLTLSDTDRAISAFGVGTARHPLSMTHVQVGQSIVVAAAVEGQMRPTSRSSARSRPAPTVAPATCGCSPRWPTPGRRWRPRTSAWPGWSARWRCCWSGAGSAPCSTSTGCPAPTGVELARWLVAFPSFGFLLCAAARP